MICETEQSELSHQDGKNRKRTVERKKSIAKNPSLFCTATRIGALGGKAREKQDKNKTITSLLVKGKKKLDVIMRNKKVWFVVE